MAANISHPAFSQPDDENILVWRYMDFVKYVAMLSSGSLYFSRVDKLGDPYEGSLTRKERNAIERTAAIEESSGKLPQFWRGRFLEVLMHSWRAAVKENYALCWHMNPSESDAMWKLYSCSNQGIAIQSSYRTLVESLPSKYNPGEFVGPYVGKINYIDHEEQLFDNKNVFFSLLHKRLSFKHESECRAIIWKCGNHKGPDPLPLEELDKNEAGILVNIPLEQLVQRVVVSPRAPSWFADVIDKTSRQFGYEFEIVRSRQELEPYL